MRVKAVQNKVCTETETVFDSEFWNSLDVVATALVSAYVCMCVCVCVCVCLCLCDFFALKGLIINLMSLLSLSTTLTEYL